MDNKTFGVSIDNGVMEQIVSLASLEVDGVDSMVTLTNVDIKRIIKGGKITGSTKVKTDNGALVIDTYIAIKEGAKPKAVAEAVQANVKAKIQDMTGNAVAAVNVHICDVVFKDTEEE